MSFPRFPAYKPSGVEWLGEVPVTWSFQKFRHLFEESTEKIETEVFGDMLSVSGYRGIELKQYDDENRRRRDEDLVGYRIVRRGQLVVNTMWLNYAGLGFSDLDGHVSPAYRAYWPKTDEDTKYLHYLLRSEHYVKGYTRLLTGVRPNSLQMSRDNMMGFSVILPPKEDQLAIATFLDHETAKIDALIAEQQRLIELLQEKRQAVISHAVTKGLNPDAPMKDSGVEWLGEVAVHWEVMPAGRVCEIFAPQRDKPDLNEIEDGYPWITLENIKNGNLVNPSAWVSIDAARVAGVRPLAAGSVIASCIGNFGIAAVTKEDSAINQQLQAYRPGSAVNAQFLQNAIISSRSYFESVCTTSTLPYVNKSGFWGLLIALPPKVEQDEIASAISQRVLKLDSLLTLSVQATGLLQERRSALISAAVTGQIDVRGLVPEAVAA